MANRHRGEVEVVLGGKSYAMRPTFEALAQIQDDTGVGLFGLLLRIRDQSPTDMVAVVYQGIRYGEDPRISPPSREDVGRAMVEEGLTKFTDPIVAFIEQALYGWEEKKTRRDGGSQEPT
jgi:hypothetical protein